jgi:hypothetical protein
VGCYRTITQQFGRDIRSEQKLSLEIYKLSIQLDDFVFNLALSEASSERRLLLAPSSRQ